MASTTSLAFPNMFMVSKNQLGVFEDNLSIVNRTRLMVLTEPTELYNSPTFGVGLKQYMFQYNNANTRTILKNKIKDQLREHEPCVKPDETQFEDDLLFTGTNDNTAQEYNKLKMTIGLVTVFGDTVSVDLNTESYNGGK